MAVCFLWGRVQDESDSGEPVQLEVTEEHAGQRMDRWLADRLQGLGRRGAARWLAAGDVRLDGRVAGKADRLVAGQRVTVQRRRVQALARGVEEDPSVAFRVVHEDASVLVVAKPAGVDCHPLREGERGCLVNGLLSRYPDLRGVGFGARESGLVHRLDRDTSGLVLVARQPEVFATLRTALREGQIDKRYLALCAERPSAERCDALLRPAGKDGARMVSDGASSAGAHVTELLEIRRVSSGWLVQVRARRAQRHQVRAHLALLGAPLIGDLRYGGPARAAGAGPRSGLGLSGGLDLGCRNR